MKLQLQLLANDKASPKLKKLSDSIAKSNQRIHQSSAATAVKQQAMLQKTSAAHKRAASARLRLGVRSEKHIQREIKQTQAAYNRLARSGTASVNELSRAYGRMTDKVSRLNRELGITSKRQRGMGKIGKTAAVASGVVAGGMVVGGMLANPMKRQMSYDRKLAMVANTAFSDRDVKGRIAGKAELAAAVKKAIDVGGGKKDDALIALDTLLASGTVGAKSAMNLLPTLQKGAVATGASTEDLSKIAISAMQQFGIKEDQIGKALDMAVAAGQAGNFELADMARWLPQQMAAAKNAGMSGMEGYKALLVANQQARVTAGSSDEAGNNLVNLLAKLTSKETNERFAKFDYQDPKTGEIKGIDYVKSMEKGKREGKDPIQSFMGIIDKVVGNDNRYQSLQKQLKTADSTEQKRLITEMTNLVEGTAVGKIVSDRQALMALLGIRNNVALGQKVSGDVANSAGAVDTSHQVIAESNDFKVEKAANDFKEAQDGFMSSFNNFLGDLSVKFSTWTKDNPNAAKGVVGGGTVLAAGGTAAAGGVVAKRLITGGAATGSTAAVANGARAAGASALAKSAVGKLASKSNLPLLVTSLFAGAANKNVWIPQGLQNRRNNAAYGTAQMNAIMASSKDKKPSIWAHAGALPIAATKQSEWANASGAYAAAAKQRETQIQQFQDMASKTEAGFKQLTAQPINVTTTNQIFIDGAQVSESVSKQQANRMSRGE